MSFLNPVNEPVKRFKSTDAGAPQINYAARTAGDVKAVLKACLVTGYGATASAGWTAVNEATSVIEFVSPSAAMSGYRLGIDDRSTSSTTWYYQDKNIKTNLPKGGISKSFESITLPHAGNGWELLVSTRGLYFIENVQSSAVNAVVSRVTYFGQIKSTLVNDIKNIGFWSVGYQLTQQPFDFFFSSPASTYYRVGSFSSLSFAASNLSGYQVNPRAYNNNPVDLISAVYLFSDVYFVGEQVGMFLVAIDDKSRIYGNENATINARPALKVCLARSFGDVSLTENSAHAMAIYTDYWEY